LHSFVFRMLLAPGTFVMLPKWDASRIAEIIPKYHVTTFLMVPSMAHQLATSPKLAKADLNGLLSVGSGAAYLPPELRERLSARIPGLVAFNEGYGMSECTNAAIVMPFPRVFPQIEEVPGFTGILLPNMKARILREDGSDADYDEPGELYLWGGNISLGYHNNSTATRQTFLPGGWLRTGDRFRVDRIGRFFYVDRAKDILKVSGTQVSPTEIENTLLEHPEELITDVAVAGVPGTRLDDEMVPRAWVVLSEKGKRKGRTYVLSTLDKSVRSRLSKPKWLRGGMQVVDEIPKLPTGKVLRRKLQDEYAASLRGKKSKAKL